MLLVYSFSLDLKKSASSTAGVVELWRPCSQEEFPCSLEKEISCMIGLVGRG